jgi:hypothetical protein
MELGPIIDFDLQLDKMLSPIAGKSCEAIDH